MWARLARLAMDSMARPRFAFSYVAALLVLGVATGSIAAQVTSRRLHADLGTRYVQSLDPFRGGDSQP
jgi:hypothetical protein